MSHRSNRPRPPYYERVNPKKRGLSVVTGGQRAAQRLDTKKKIAIEAKRAWERFKAEPKNAAWLALNDRPERERFTVRRRDGT